MPSWHAIELWDKNRSFIPTSTLLELSIQKMFWKSWDLRGLLGNATIDGDGNENFLNALIVGKP